MARMKGPMRRTARRMKRAASRTATEQYRYTATATRRGRRDRDTRREKYYAAFEEFGRRVVIVAIVIAVALLALVVAGRWLNHATDGRVTYYAPPRALAAADTATPAATATRYALTADADAYESPTPRLTATATPRPAVASGNVKPQRINADGSITIGGDTVPKGIRCGEDETIYFVNWIRGQYEAPDYGAPLGCVHYEYLVADFIAECLIGDSERGTNLASEHARVAAYLSWCSDVVDYASDGILSLDAILVDMAAR